MRRLCLFALCTITALSVALPVLADDKKDEGKKEEGGAPPVQAPPAELDQIASLVGEWKVESVTPPQKMFPNGSKDEGTFVVKKAVGGMYLIGDMSSKGGMGDFSGHELIGYNAMEKKFKSFWFDSEMSGYASQGTGDFKDNTLTLDSEETMGPPGSPKMVMRITYKFDGKDKIDWKGEMKQGDQWVTWMTATYTRTK